MESNKNNFKMQNFIKKMLVLIVTLCYISITQAQWTQDNVKMGRYRPNGQSLPDRAIVLGKYFSGTLNIKVGDSENEIVVTAEAFEAEGTYTNHESNKRDMRAYIFCMCFKDNPFNDEYFKYERQKLFIPDRNQACREINGASTIKYKIPDHASYIIFTLSQASTQSISSFESSNNYAYWSDEILLEKCGIAPFLTKMVEFSIKRPYRSEAVNRVEQSDGIEFITCYVCNGTGKEYIAEGKAPCPRCNGTGWYSSHYKCGMDPYGRSKNLGCGGSGKIIQKAHYEQCSKCKGRGKLPK